MRLFLKLPFDQNARMINYKRNDGFKSHIIIGWNTKTQKKLLVLTLLVSRDGGKGGLAGAMPPPPNFQKKKNYTVRNFFF
jgi:hypothetical protein